MTGPGAGWSAADGFYVAVSTLTTSSIPNPKLTITGPWPEIFTAAYVLIGIGILVEVARRLGMGRIAAREELRTAKAATKAEESVGSSRPEARGAFPSGGRACGNVPRAV